MSVLYGIEHNNKKALLILVLRVRSQSYPVLTNFSEDQPSDYVWSLQHYPFLAELNLFFTDAIAQVYTCRMKCYTILYGNGPENLY